MIYNKQSQKGRFFWKLAIAVALFMITYSIGIYAQEAGNKLMLSESYPKETLKNILVSKTDWYPFPTANERNSWMFLPEKTRQSHIARGERALNYDWPSLPATLFLQFARNGNRSNYERPSFNRRSTLCNLVIAECIEGKGRFIDDIVNGVWAICEESYWGVPAHMYMQKIGPGLPDIAEPTVDLFVAETVSLLAWTVYLLEPQLDSVSPLVCERIKQEMERRVLIPCLERDDFWWMGFKDNRVNNWNPWCNSNWLTAVLLMETDEDRRLEAVHKILKSLDKFISGYPPDGGCDEGPSYWGRAGASLFDCLELLYSATNGAINVYNEPLIQEIGRYIYRAHIHDDYFINFADAPAKVSLAGDLVYRYGSRIADKNLSALGAFAGAKRHAKNPYVSGSIGRQLPAIFNLSELLTAEAYQPLLRNVWFPNLQVMAVRSNERSSKGLFVAAKGGHNNESHNHNDVGNFIVYMDGRPAIIDVGVETYTKKTFSPQRYEIWTMQSAFHNLPTINGVMQEAGRKFAARNVTYKSNESYAQLTLDIAGAYPSEAGVDSWLRSIHLNRGKEVIITDTYELTDAASNLTLTLMTSCEVTVDKPGLLTLKEVPVEANNQPFIIRIHYNANKLKVNLENIAIEDGRLKSLWGNRLTRILLRTDTPQLSDTLIMQITE